MIEEKLNNLSKQLPPDIKDRYNKELNVVMKQLFLIWYFGEEKYKKFIK